VLQLAEDYAAACRGEVPANFRFAWTKNSYEILLLHMGHKVLTLSKMVIPVLAFLA
jgi:hypothetical protein